MRSTPRPPSPPAERPTGAVAAQRAALAALLASMPDAALALDDTGLVFAANDPACALLGRSREALLARPFAARGGDAPSTAALLSALGPGESCPLLTTLTRADGAPVAADASATRLALDGPPLYVCYLRDRTERRDVQAALQRRDQQFAVFFEHSPASCFQKDLDGRYELINETCARLWGLDRVACIGKTDHELFPAAAADQFRASDRAALASGEVYVCEQSAASPRGERHVLAHKFPIRDASGRIVSIAGIAFDVTDLKRAEARLRDGEARLRTIVQGMPVLLDAFDDQGLIVAWNSECERVTGYAAAEIINNPRAMELLYPDPASREAMLAEASELRNEEYSRVFELVAKDGTPRIIEWFNVGARLKIDGWLEWSVGLDITARRRLEEALHQATVLEQRRLGHDLHDGLGQELTGLSLLASSLARRHGKRDPQLADALRALADIAAHAIGTCKAVARGLAPVEDAEHGLATALRRLTESFPDPAGSLEVTFAEESSAPSQVSLAACNHLYRIAQEALSNAVRHAGAHTVRVELRTERERLRLRISDDGGGFGKQHTQHAGMGLRTMRHRANAIGARLSIAAGRHGGTVVTCECPNRETEPRRIAER